MILHKDEELRIMALFVTIDHLNLNLIEYA